MSIQQSHRASAASQQASERKFYPAAAVKCDGPLLFRSQCARDVACLLDVDHAVKSWTCMPPPLALGDRSHVPDFAVYRHGGEMALLDAPDRVPPVPLPDFRQVASRDQR